MSENSFFHYVWKSWNVSAETTYQNEKQTNKWTHEQNKNKTETTISTTNNPQNKKSCLRRHLNTISEWTAKAWQKLHQTENFWIFSSKTLVAFNNQQRSPVAQVSLGKAEDNHPDFFQQSLLDVLVKMKKLSSSPTVITNITWKKSRALFTHRIS